MEAYKTNVLGTENVLDSALEHHVRNVIILSTDKAVYPINAMGISKAMMEKVMVAKARSLGENAATIYCGTRYGNVMASRGSVIPLFISQIRAGKDITVTDPEMTRFLMNWDDANKLVMIALKNGSNGDMFIKKSPAASIHDLATTLVELYNSKSQVRIIGTRHGEKLYETLVNREEMAIAKDRGDYFQVPADVRDLNYEQYFSIGKEKVSAATEYTSHNAHQLNRAQIREMLMKLPIIRKDILSEEVDPLFMYS
jgi:UDP-glucose 4-epimerase